MKYRIKIVEYPDGTKKYYPQFKMFFLWQTFYGYSAEYDMSFIKEFDSEEQCLQYMKEYAWKPTVSYKRVTL